MVKYKSFMLAEIICDGGASTWRNGQCAYGRFQIRSESINQTEHVDFPGKFGTESCGFAEWMALINSVQALRESVLCRKESTKGYMVLIYMDYLPAILTVQNGQNCKSPEIIGHKNRVKNLLNQFGGYSFQWVGREYVEQVLGC